MKRYTNLKDHISNNNHYFSALINLSAKTVKIGDSLYEVSGQHARIIKSSFDDFIINSGINVDWSEFIFSNSLMPKQKFNDCAIYSIHNIASKSNALNLGDLERSGRLYNEENLLLFRILLATS